jgi:N6-adenosine-specific RNA methylase IME4
VLFGVRGSLGTRSRSLMSWFEARRSKHSAKPDCFHDLVQQASPGPYLELFARCRRASQLICYCTRCRLGWEVWGNEA